jgi:hypothetical protein
MRKIIVLHNKNNIPIRDHELKLTEEVPDFVSYNNKYYKFKKVNTYVAAVTFEYHEVDVYVL